MSVKPIPEGYNTLTPYLIINNAAQALQFYKQAFGAIERMRMEGEGGKVCHAEMQIGNSIIMLADEFPQMDAHGPQKFGGTPVMLHLYVEDVDTIFNQALNAGATIVKPLADQFYGDRLGSVKDPFGHIWSVATHKEDLTMDEINKRFSAANRA
jgi:PhnB protein